MPPQPIRRGASWERASPSDRAAAAKIVYRERHCSFCKGVALGVIIGAIALALVLEWLTSEEVALAGRGAVADGPGSRLADEPEFAEGSR